MLRARPLPATIESTKTCGSQQGVALMKRTTKYVAFDVHQAQPLPRLRRLRLQILLAIHANQLEEIAQRERPDEQAEQAELRYAADRADQRDEGRHLGEAAIDQRPDEVVHASDHDDTPDHE